MTESEKYQELLAIVKKFSEIENSEALDIAFIFITVSLDSIELLKEIGDI